MKKHVKNYLNYFELGEQSFIYCEYHFVKYGAMIRGVDLHHIKYKSRGGTDEVINIICLCRECHNLAHSEQLKMPELNTAHRQFLDCNPYL